MKLSFPVLLLIVLTALFFIWEHHEDSARSRHYACLLTPGSCG